MPQNTCSFLNNLKLNVCELWQDSFRTLFETVTNFTFFLFLTVGTSIEVSAFTVFGNSKSFLETKEHMPVTQLNVAIHHSLPVLLAKLVERFSPHVVSTNTVSYHKQNNRAAQKY